MRNFSSEPTDLEDKEQVENMVKSSITNMPLDNLPLNNLAKYLNFDIHATTLRQNPVNFEDKSVFVYRFLAAFQISLGSNSGL
jgi:hypothetical protein